MDVKEVSKIKKRLHATEVKLCVSVYFCLMGYLPTDSVSISAAECKGRKQLH
jgi:hypothetical protein